MAIHTTAIILTAMVARTVTVTAVTRMVMVTGIIMATAATDMAMAMVNMAMPADPEWPSYSGDLPALVITADLSMESSGRRPDERFARTNATTGTQAEPVCSSLVRLAN